MISSVIFCDDPYYSEIATLWQKASAEVRERVKALEV